MDGRTQNHDWINRDNAIAALELGLNAFMWIGMAVVGFVLAVGF